MKQILKWYLFGLLLSLITFSVGLTGCEKPIDDVVVPPTSEDELVTVSLNLGFAEESSGELYRNGSPKRLAETARVEGSQAAFNASLTSGVMTRASTDVPDKLYNLEIRQYELDGSYIPSTGGELGTKEVGEHLEVTLATRDDCQLVIVARGSGPAVSTLGSKSLSEVQDMTVSSSAINAIDPAATNGMNAMPYVLHLEHVKVALVNDKPVIQSIDGSYDARLMLKRLATRLTVNWNYTVSGYKLKQLLLQSVPMNYAIVNKPESDGTYPSIVSQFTILEAKITDDNAAEGSYSWWVPANVRGENAAATSDLQRIKANAPTGSSFLNFVATSDADIKKKLDYRVYIGSGASTDFNMYLNKDYVYTVNFSHTGIPVNDKRVTYIDPIPASENNDNKVPTANCFMVAPGGAFCFDPFAYQQNGAEITNTEMTGWYNTTGTGIKSVKLLWQTRENGDVGDPVMGIANSTGDQTNIVDIKRTDGSSIITVPANNKGQCLIYCRVAANTSGGSGAIAAYDGEDGTGNIVWSWHVWVTDYHPSATGSEAVYEPVNQRKLRFTKNNPNVLPMMDRNLGAMAGYIDEAPKDFVEKSKTHGFHYQWGRKDPYPSSYTIKQIPNNKIDNKDADTPPDGMQNRYKADGITYVKNEGKKGTVSPQASCQQPLAFYAANGEGPAWSNSDSDKWGGTNKTVWDPCPAGWRIASKDEMKAIVAEGTGLADPTYGNRNIKNFATREEDGGFLVYFETTNTHTSYFRFTGYGRYFNTFDYIGILCTLWTRNKGNSNQGIAYRLPKDNGDTSAGIFTDKSMYGSDAHPVRCIQEKQ